MNNGYPSVEWEPYIMSPELFEHFFGEKNEDGKQLENNGKNIDQLKDPNISHNILTSKGDLEKPDPSILYNRANKRCKEILIMDQKVTMEHFNLSNFDVPKYDWVYNREKKINAKKKQEETKNKPSNIALLPVRRFRGFSKLSNKVDPISKIEDDNSKNQQAKESPKFRYTNLLDVFDYLGINAFFVILFFLFIVLLKIFNM